MKDAARGLFFVAIAAVTVATTGPAIAEDLYSGVRLWDSGPYTVWSGVDANNPALQIVAIKGAHKSFSLTFPAAVTPSIQYLSNRVEVALPGNGTYGLHPVGPYWGFIMHCRSWAGMINCICEIGAATDVCDQAGIVEFAPNNGWYDM